MNLQKNNIKRYILRRYSIDELESIFNQKLNNQSRNFKHYANMSSNKFMVIVVSSITEEILVQLTDGWVEDSPIPEEGLYKFIQEIFGERIIKKYDELTNMNLQEQTNRIKQMMGIIKESSDEEAWELVGQDDKVIKSIVKQTGYKNDEESVERLIPIIDSLPTEEVDYTQIKTFHNLENKSNDKGLLSKMYQISKTDDPRKEYGEYMDKRDSGENRNRGYKPVKNYDRIVNDEYESPVVLKHNKKYYVGGGRTRLYASVAANKPIKIKILTKNDL